MKSLLILVLLFSSLKAFAFNQKMIGEYELISYAAVHQTEEGKNFVDFGVLRVTIAGKDKCSARESSDQANQFQSRKELTEIGVDIIQCELKGDFINVAGDQPFLGKILLRGRDLIILQDDKRTLMGNEVITLSRVR